MSDDLSKLVDRLSALLTGVANALKGAPPALVLHDWSDLPQVAAQTMARITELSEARLLADRDAERLGKLIDWVATAQAIDGAVRRAEGGGASALWKPTRYEHELMADLRIESRGFGNWAVTRGVMVLNYAGEWEYEPMPSSRDEAFILRTRWGTYAAAELAANAAIAVGGGPPATA